MRLEDNCIKLGQKYKLFYKIALIENSVAKEQWEQNKEDTYQMPYLV